MWFIRVKAGFNGSPTEIPVITELVSLSLLGGQLIYPTMFFNYFNGCPSFNVLSDFPVLKETEDEMLEKLDGLYKEKETQERITTA